MAIEYKPGMTKPELLELAVVNGIDVDDSMTKAKIIAAIDAHNAQEAAESGGEGNNTTPDENGGQSGKESVTGNADAGGGDDTAGSGEEDEQDGAGSDEEPREGNNTTPDENAAQSATEGEQDVPGGYDLFVYAGPTLPRGRLKENAVFRGTFEDVKAYLADVLEVYPQVARLIVPVNRLAAFSVKVKTPGNLAHKYYSDIVSAMRGNREV